jgi:hypothetical protein
MIRLRKSPLASWRMGPQRAELRPIMTICIAATTGAALGESDIVLASDRLLTSLNDSVPGAETLKARKISKTWALMFAGDGDLFLPIYSVIKKKLENTNNDLATVQTAGEDTYRTFFDEQFTARYLSRYGISSISEFRILGLQQFGNKFTEICEAIDQFDLGIDLLISGFDVDGVSHIFDVRNPGFATNHDLLGYAAIGTGETMALASLRRKPLPNARDALVYRVLEAKFSAETAAGVGPTTALFTMRSSGKDGSINRSRIEKVKKVYKAELNKPDPRKAIKIISDSLGSRAD